MDRARARLRTLFVARLSERVTDLNASLDALKGGEAEGDKKIRNIAHQLRGTGTSFGFPDITASAAEVELSSPEALLENTTRFIALLEQHAQTDG